MSAKTLAEVRALPCCRCGRHPTEYAPTRAHHQTGMGKGKGQKNPDDRTMPLCFLCHNDFHALAGKFKGWGRERLRKWQNTQVLRAHGRV